MKILDAGHRYILNGYDVADPQGLVFMKREGPAYPWNTGTHGGTNCQEVLRVLIDRVLYLGRQEPCAETEAILGCLRTALFLFESRAARKRGRTLDAADLDSLVREPTCPECGHVRCDSHREAAP